MTERFFLFLLLFLPSFVFAQTFPTHSAAMGACKSHISDVSLGCVPAAACVCKDFSPPDPSTHVGVVELHTNTYNGTMAFYNYKVSCIAGLSSHSNASGTSPMNDGDTVCSDGCRESYKGDPVNICLDNNDGTKFCLNTGTFTQTGEYCGNASNPNPNDPPPKPPENPDPKICDGNSTCFTPTPPQICNGSNCVPIPPPPSVPNACDAQNNSALCVGNPPPIPPPPPTGPDNNCNGKSANFSDSASGFQATSFDHCPPPRSSCPAGTSMSDSGNCVQDSVCPAGSTKNARGECQQPSTCPDGSSKDSNGNCVQGCPAGSTRDSQGRCNAGCPAGSTKNAAGICVGTCVAGQTQDANGQCTASCGQGLKKDQSTGECVSDNQASGGTDCQTPPVCRGDQVLCNIDYQAWAARCAASPGESSKGDLSSLYTKTGDTVSSVMSKYQSQFQSSPLVNAASNFLTVNASGSCPTLSIPSGAFMGTNIWAGLDANILCDGPLLNIMDLAGYVVLALAAFQAFRIALY